MTKGADSTVGLLNYERQPSAAAACAITRCSFVVVVIAEEEEVEKEGQTKEDEEKRTGMACPRCCCWIGWRRKDVKPGVAAASTAAAP